MAGKAKNNVRIITDEVKLSGILNAEDIENGSIILESDENEIDVSQFIRGFDGTDVELTIKKKVETAL